MTKHERNILTPEEIEDQRVRLAKRRAWVERKIAHWARMGTPSELRGSAACPKWKIEADKARAKKLLDATHRPARAEHHRKIGA
jgi:hypothetical protein